MKTGNKDYLKQTQKDYSLAFKLQVVDEVEKGHMTYKQALPFTMSSVVRTVLTFNIHPCPLRWFNLFNSESFQNVCINDYKI